MHCLSLFESFSCSLSFNPFHALSLSLSILFVLSLSFNPLRALSHTTHLPLNNSFMIDGSIILIYSQSIAQSLILINSLARDNTSKWILQTIPQWIMAS
jgi:hypothetical protein